MSIYRVFGGYLRSPMDLPELRKADVDDAPLDWEFELGEAASLEAGVELGREQLLADVSVRLMRLPDGRHALAFDDTGTFVIDAAGKRITWQGSVGAVLELVRADLIGRVLAMAVHVHGLLCLHASGVERVGRAIGFLAPKGYGKTTTALALVERGARLLTDDTLPMDVRTGTALPGVHVARLTSEGVSRYASLGKTRPSLSDKSFLDELPADRIADQPSPVSALYVLEPLDRAGSTTITRMLLPGPFATMSLVQHSKLGPLLGGPAALEVFDRAAALAATVPVYLLKVPRDLAVLDREAGRLEEWLATDPVRVP
jgi:hypothetical protein